MPGGLFIFPYYETNEKPPYHNLQRIPIREMFISTKVITDAFDDSKNIREVIMFPMNQRAEDPMLGSPRFPTDDQLEELKLRVIEDDIV